MRLYFLTKKSLKASSHDSKLGFEEGSYSMTLLVVVVVTVESLLPAVARNIVLSRLLSKVAKSWSQPEYTLAHIDKDRV